MGYRRNQKTLALTFTGELEGLEVRVRMASPEVMRHIVNVAENAQQGALAEQANRVLDLCDSFAGLLDSWNYQDEQGNPIPATAKALSQEDAAFVIALAFGWLDAMAVRAEQLSQAAPQPDSTLEAELPMEALS